MSKLEHSASPEQLYELMEYISNQIKIPTIGVGGGYAPIGTIISYMGTIAPQDYLICDGTTYNIADYQQLATFFATQFGSSNFFGGDGNTTFKVPDLRGEFLRGTGTNGHANQGSGANVGTHQDGTEHNNVEAYNTAGSGDIANKTSVALEIRNTDINAWGAIVAKQDKLQSNKNPRFVAEINNVPVRNTSTETGRDSFTSRPTNTSILWCIKAIDAGEVYSITERRVGTWIDGKPIYQKTFTGTKVSGTDSQIDATNLAIDKIISINGILDGNNTNIYPIPNYQASEYNIFSFYHKSLKIIYIMSSNADYYNGAFSLTIQYTKTTD